MTKTNRPVPTVELFHEDGRSVRCNAAETKVWRAKGFEPAGTPVQSANPRPVVTTDVLPPVDAFPFHKHGLVALRAWSNDAGISYDGKDQAALAVALSKSGYTPKGE